MAQVLAAPGDSRHGFSFIKTFSYSDVGRISGLAVTKLGNIIVCDNLRNKLVLFDEDGNYLSYLPVEGDPWDIAINRDNLAFITIPNKGKVLVVDPDILLCRCCTEIWNEFDRNDILRPLGVSSIYNASEVMILESNLARIVELKDDMYLRFSESIRFEKNNGSKMYSRKGSKVDTHYICVPVQNSIHLIRRTTGHTYDVKIPTMTVPSDICSDDNGHIYISGQYSHNIHRLTEDGKVLDIPLNSRHGIKHPVAICFNQPCTKFYIANAFGTNIQIYNVV